MPRSVTHADFLVEWERMLTALEQNAADFPDASANREKLQSLLDGAKANLMQQAQHIASKQTASQSVKEAIAKGRKVATVLRVMIKERYGNRSEKLAEFNLQPFRGRTKPPELPPIEMIFSAGRVTPAEDIQ